MTEEKFKRSIHNVSSSILRGRIEYIDALRGFTMLLVVYHHLHYFCYGELLVSADNKTVNDIVKVFFMPLFFFISGFTSYKREFVYSFRNSSAFLFSKVKQLIIPTVFFLVLFLILFNYPFSIALTDKMKAGYWFTFTLFEFLIFYIITNLLIRKFNLAGFRSDLFLLFLTILFCGLSGLPLIGITNDLIGFFGIGQWCYYIFFIIGILGRKHSDSFQRLMDSSFFMGGLLLLFFGSIYFYYLEWYNFTWQFILAYILLGVSGPFVLVAYFRRYKEVFSSKNPLGKYLQLIGRHTLEIYLLHYFFLPRSLDGVAEYFVLNPSFVIELVISISIAFSIICVCVVTGSLIRLSDKLGAILLGRKA